MFLNQEYSLSEAQIAYVEVPKIALLRSLAGAIAIVWSIEWAITSRTFEGSFSSHTFASITSKLQPSTAWSGFKNWLAAHPSRWLVLAACLFFGSTFVSTILSGSLVNSIWGEIPGQDGYSAYTVFSYGLIFAAIATHLKDRGQLTRLLGAVILMGTLAGTYAIFQHFGNDFLGTLELTGGGASRVTVFMGNTIFAGAVLSMTVPTTLMASTLNFHNENWGDWGPLARLNQLGRDTLVTFLWAVVLSSQLLGLMFTYSRGPWAGTVLALAVFIGLVAVSLGWRVLVRTGLVLGLAVLLSIAFLHLRGSVSIIDVGPWLGYVIATIGVAGTYAVLFVISRFSRAVIFIAVSGIAIAVIGSAIIAPTALSGRGAASPTDTGPDKNSEASQAIERITSIKSDVLGGFVGGRGTHWKVSWELISERPWFEFDNLHLSWLRPLIGYGPDLFRYTYLIRSPAEDIGLRPLEPDHAHNFFIHQTVEQGYIGGFASLALFISVIGVSAHHVLRRRVAKNPFYPLLLFGLTAVIVGRLLEMMVGVARVSDLTVLWVIFGLFVALANLDTEQPETANAPAARPSEARSRRDRRRASRASTTQPMATGMIFRLAVVALLVGGVGVVTWQKSVNYVRASVAEGQALQHFRAGDFATTIEYLDKAITLAPGVPSYYNNRSNIFLAYKSQPETAIEPTCNAQDEQPYLVCLGLQALESNLESVNQQPFNYRSRLAASNSFVNLRLSKSAVDYYGDAIALVPNSWSIRNHLAESLMDLGSYDEALWQLDQSLDITRDSSQSSRALSLTGRALMGLDRPRDALTSLKLGISLRGDVPVALGLIRDIYTELGVKQDIGYFDHAIDQDPKDAAAHYFRGLVHLATGNSAAANSDIEASIALGLTAGEVLANRGYARLKSDDLYGARQFLAAALESMPQSALAHAYLAEFSMSMGEYTQALDFSDNAIKLNSNLGLAYLIRGQSLISLGQQEAARELVETWGDLELPTVDLYVDLGEIYAFFGKSDLAISHLSEAIRINPNQSMYYNSRARIYATIGDYESALRDFDTAIQIDPTNARYFVNRGVLYYIVGTPEHSLTDFQSARNMEAIEIPQPGVRNKSYFAVSYQ
jgi:tetratricopeptide (TPR) repeat protein